MLSYQRLLTVYSSAWLLWMLLQAGVLYYAKLSWSEAITDSAISNILLAATCFATGNALRYYQPGKNNWQHLLLWDLVLAGIWLWLSNTILSAVFRENALYIEFLKRSLPARYFIAFLMIGMVVLLTWIWHYISSQQDAENRKSSAERLAKEAELSRLRQQLQPHFLFNSLNSISALIGTKPEEARKMIQQLSDFLRGTLRKDEQQLTTLAVELQHLQLYLDIEKVRFGHRLNAEVKYNEKSRELFLPALLLQPLVENAIKFGLYDTTGDVAISISATTEDQYLLLRIENPFDPETAQPRQGTGFGLRSVQRRLFLLYNRNDLLETKMKDRLFITSVKIPQLA